MSNTEYRNISYSNCRASHSGDALRVGGVCAGSTGLDRVGTVGKLRAQSLRDRPKV